MSDRSALAELSSTAMQERRHSFLPGQFSRLYVAFRPSRGCEITRVTAKKSRPDIGRLALLRIFASGVATFADEIQRCRSARGAC